MRRLKWIGITLVLLLGLLTAWPEAQGQFWVLVNGALQYNGPVRINGTTTLNGSVTATSLSTSGNGLAIAGAGSLFLGNTMLINATAPTISSGFGTTPSIVSSNGSATFRVNVGTGGAATSGVVGLATAANGWNCMVIDTTNNTVTRETAFTTATVTVTAASAWAASDNLIYNCMAF